MPPANALLSGGRGQAASAVGQCRKSMAALIQPKPDRHQVVPAAITSISSMWGSGETQPPAVDRPSGASSHLAGIGSGLSRSEIAFGL
jgi:hypothetical protein